MSSKKPSNRSSKQSLNQDIQGQLNEFYKVAKQKLLAVKKDLEDSQNTYKQQKESNRKKELKYNELMQESKTLDLRIKGMNEKLIIAKRNETNLDSQINETKAAIKSASQEIDYLKLNTDQKVKRVETDSNMINTFKENEIKGIQERIEKENENKKELIEKIKEAQNRIKELMGSISSATEMENKKNNTLLNEAAEMNKFLSEL